MTFGGRTAFITGGAIGFGRAFARALWVRAPVWRWSTSTSTWPNALLPNWFSDGGQAIAVDCDVADPDKVDAAVAQRDPRPV